MKKVLGVIGFVLVAGVFGYFFIYPYDYIVRFEADTFPGTINQTIKIWHDSEGVINTDIEQEDLYRIKHRIKVGDSTHVYQWDIEPLTDSTSRVVVKIRDEDHSFANKLQAPFGGSIIEASSKRMVSDFVGKLNEHIDRFKVRIEGLSELPDTFYMYVDLERDQLGKAAGMMEYYNFLSDLILQGGVTLNGPPMIVVDEWDRETDSLKYKFCFPIIRSDQLPQHPEIKYKRIFPQRAIKAIYNGNYITSDRAWYALLTYAQQQGLEVEETPVEVFFNNPTLGGDATRWTAEVYLPLKDTEP